MSRAEPGRSLRPSTCSSARARSSRRRRSSRSRPRGRRSPSSASIVGPIAGRRGERHRRDAVRRPRRGARRRCTPSLDDVQAGNGWIVEIGGAAGDRQVAPRPRSSSSAAPDVRVLQRGCEEYEASTPYFALRAPMRAAAGARARTATPPRPRRRLREVVARVDRELVPWVPLLGILLGLDLPPTPETSSLDDASSARCSPT